MGLQTLSKSMWFVALLKLPLYRKAIKSDKVSPHSQFLLFYKYRGSSIFDARLLHHSVVSTGWCERQWLRWCTGSELHQSFNSNFSLWNKLSQLSVSVTANCRTVYFTGDVTLNIQLLSLTVHQSLADPAGYLTYHHE